MLNSTKRDAATNTVVNADGTWINKKARISSTNNFADLPSDDWFVQSFGPLPVSSSNSNTANLNKRKKPLKNKVKPKKIKKSNQTPSTSELVQLEVSDGEDIFEAFPPVSSLKNQKEEKTGATKEDKSEKKNKTSNSFEDDDLDFVILFESIGGKTPVKEETISSDLSDSDEDNLTTSTNQLKKSKVNLKPTSRSTTKTTVEERFGVTSSFSKQILEHLAQNLKKFPKEFEAFNTSIWTHFTENLQNDHTYVWKMRVKNILDEIIKELFPNDSTSLVAVGSTVNGCGAFNSDMDLCLCMPCEADGYDTRRSYAINRLRKVMRKLMNRKSLIHDIQYIPAKVPILKIKFKHPYQKLEVDINVNNVPGIYNSYLIHYYSRIDDRFPALCLVAKHWAKKKGILDACSGFFNSYSLILMVLHFLQCGLDTPILPNLQFLYPEYFHFHRPLEDMKLFNELPTPIPEIPKNNLSVGELLIAFFHYYNNFDFEEYAISVNRGSVYPRSELSRSTMRFKIFIEEPFDFKNTARCVTNEECYEEILNKFREAVGLLKCPPNLKKLIS